ncbi:MAG TPA: hypothetical protein VHN79_03295, partial [Lacunisphaera sp.]|nr:hypothetical protein [Lacunisphaera sp.]
MRAVDRADIDKRETGPEGESAPAGRLGGNLVAQISHVGKAYVGLGRATYSVRPSKRYDAGRFQKPNLLRPIKMNVLRYLKTFLLTAAVPAL